MACYVDEPNWERWHGLSGHLIADSVDELHQFATQLSLSKKFFMDGAITPHYQLPAGRLDAAIREGAILLERPAFMRVVERINHTRPSRSASPSKKRELDARKPSPGQPLLI